MLHTKEKAHACSSQIQENNKNTAKNISKEQEIIEKNIIRINEKLASEPDNYNHLCTYIPFLSKLIDNYMNSDRVEPIPHEEVLLKFSELESLRRKTMSLYSLSVDMITEWVKDITKEFKYKIKHSSLASPSKIELLKNEEFVKRCFYVYDKSLDDFYYMKILKKFFGFLLDLRSNNKELTKISNGEEESYTWKELFDKYECSVLILLEDVSEHSFTSVIEPYIDLLIQDLSISKIQSCATEDKEELITREDITKGKISKIHHLFNMLSKHPRKNYPKVIEKYNFIEQSDSIVQGIDQSKPIFFNDEENARLVLEKTKFFDNIKEVLSKTGSNNSNSDTILGSRPDSAPVIRLLNKLCNKMSPQSFYYYFEKCLLVFSDNIEFWTNYLPKHKSFPLIEANNINNNFFIRQYKRATKFCFYDSKLWILYFRELERISCPFNQTIQTIDSSLASCQEKSFIFQILKYKIEYLCRNYNGTNQFLEYFRSAYFSAVDLLLNMDNKEFEVESDLYSMAYKVTNIALEFETYMLADFSQVELIFNKMIIEKGILENTENKVEMLTQYINLIKHSNNKDLIRKIFLFLINEFKAEYSEEFYQLFVAWEKVFGDANTIIESLEYKSKFTGKDIGGSSSFIAKKKIRFESEDKNYFSHSKSNKKDFIGGIYAEEKVSIVNKENSNCKGNSNNHASESYITPKGNKTKSLNVESNEKAFGKEKSFNNLLDNRGKKTKKENNSDLPLKEDSNTVTVVNREEVSSIGKLIFGVNNKNNTSDVPSNKLHFNKEGTEKSTENQDEKTTLIFKNLSKNMTSIDLEKLLSPCFSSQTSHSKILDIRIVMNDNGESKGLAFVDIDSLQSAQQIVSFVKDNNYDKNISCAISRCFEENDDRTLFINNLPYQTNKEQISSLFLEFGSILDIRLIQDPHTQRLKGYGFIEFSDSEAVSAILTKDREVEKAFVIGERHIIVKPSKSYNKIKHGIKYVAFVSNLSYSIQTEKELEDFFKEHNCAERIINITLQRKLNGDFKGFAFAEFTTEEDLIKVIELNGKQLMNRAISIKKAMNNQNNYSVSNNNHIQYSDSIKEERFLNKKKLHTEMSSPLWIRIKLLITTKLKESKVQVCLNKN